MMPPINASVQNASFSYLNLLAGREEPGDSQHNIPATTEMDESTKLATE